VPNTTLDLDQLEITIGEIVRFPDGGVVFLKGDEGHHAYVVRTGKVEIREAGRAVEAMELGELFGEMAIIDLEPRSASAVAVGATELIVIDRDTFSRLVHEVPGFAMTIMRLMSRRLRATMATKRSSEERFPLVQTPSSAA
jgi:CRP-like cAMP-binding protein